MLLFLIEFNHWQQSCSMENRRKEFRMLYWALLFLLIAILAAVFGFTGISLLAAGVAKILFFIFLVLLVLSLVAGLVRRA